MDVTENYLNMMQLSFSLKPVVKGIDKAYDEALDGVVASTAKTREAIASVLSRIAREKVISSFPEEKKLTPKQKTALDEMLKKIKEQEELILQNKIKPEESFKDVLDEITVMSAINEIMGIQSERSKTKAVVIRESIVKVLKIKVS